MEPPHDHADHHHCLRLRGLPFSTTPAQLLDWFSGYNVIDGLITRSDGEHASGSAWNAIALLLLLSINKFWHVTHPWSHPGAVLMYLAPQGAPRPEKFDLKTNCTDCTFMLHLHVAGKPNGQAFVLLPKAEALKAQVELNNKYMGKRFIECVGLRQHWHAVNC